MDIHVRSRRRAVSLTVLVLVVLLAALVASAVPRAGADAAEHGDMQHAQTERPSTAAQAAFHDQMRKLWEDHVTWTRMAIVAFADGSAGFDATATRLLQNQTDIGDAIKPFYGEEAGSELSALLHDHITIAVDVLTAAKAGDTAAFDDARTRWYANADDIADFLAAANPHAWPTDIMRADMAMHLDQTLAEASDELHGDYPASVADYEAIHLHILDMADQLSAGIMQQFPHRFR
jgi:hypothetical protein